MEKLRIWLHNKRALSPIFATVLLATIIILFGSVAYYYANNLTQTATNNYSNTIANSQKSISERIGFENVVYTQSSSKLTVYIINSGAANNVKLNSIFIYNMAYSIVGGSPYTLSTNPLKNIDTKAPIPGNALNVGNEGYFDVTLSSGLSSGSTYTIHLITQSGSSFDYEFTA